MYSLREVLSDVLFKKGSICYGLFPILKTVVQQSKAGFEIFLNNSFTYLELAPIIVLTQLRSVHLQQNLFLRTFFIMDLTMIQARLNIGPSYRYETYLLFKHNA